MPTRTLNAKGLTLGPPRGKDIPALALETIERIGAGGAVLSNEAGDLVAVSRRAVAVRHAGGLLFVAGCGGGPSVEVTAPGARGGPHFAVVRAADAELRLEIEGEGAEAAVRSLLSAIG